MKSKRLFLIFLAAAALLVFASAAGGDSGDPLISLEQLRQVFLPAAEKAVQAEIDSSGNAVYDAAEAKWRAAAGVAEGDFERAAFWNEKRFKQGDRLSGVTGTQVLLLAGDVTADFPSGTVVDVSDGSEIVSGSSLKARHRYLVAEDTGAQFTVSSRTAVLDFNGDYSNVESIYGPDYNAMAYALKSLSLFRGSDTGYGDAFDLEQKPTRIQALIMLIRLLGEENEALSTITEHPFLDVPAWAAPYVGFAYERGYTNGVSAKEFAPDSTASAGMYIEFILRAMGYSDTTQTDVKTSAERAQNVGVMTAGERALLQSNEFLRSDVVYLSWYALATALPGGDITLHEYLENEGVFSSAAYQDSLDMVTSERL